MCIQLNQLITECAFQLNHNLYKQKDVCSMGGPLSVSLCDIHMIRTERDVVTPLKPTLKPFLRLRYISRLILFQTTRFFQW